MKLPRCSVMGTLSFREWYSMVQGKRFRGTWFSGMFNAIVLVALKKKIKNTQ